MKVQDNQEEEGTYGDSDFLAMNDLAIKKFRESENDAKHKIINKMLTLRHNMKYNKHLLSVYTKAKVLFDTMVEEHRAQIDSLDEIYRHLNQMIRENLSKQRLQKKKDSVSSELMKELVNDKTRIGLLLKKMRISYEKLMNVDTILGVTVDKINDITFIDDEDRNNDKNSDGEEDEDDDVDEDYDDDVDAEDDVDEDDDEDREIEDEDDEDEDEDNEDEVDDEESDSDSESEDDEDKDDLDDEDSEDDDDKDSESEDEEDDNNGEKTTRRAIFVF